MRLCINEQRFEYLLVTILTKSGWNAAVAMSNNNACSDHLSHDAACTKFLLHYEKLCVSLHRNLEKYYWKG